MSRKYKNCITINAITFYSILIVCLAKQSYSVAISEKSSSKSSIENYERSPLTTYKPYDGDTKVHQFLRNERKY